MAHTVADILVDVLQKIGVRQIFGLIGDSLNPLADSVRRSAIEWIGVRHEEGAALAASGQAKLTGTLGVCAGTTGPGSTHLVAGLYEASREYVSEVLTRIQRSIAELNIQHEASRVASRLTLSIGAAFIRPSSNRTPEGLIQLADEALYSAKELGRNRVVVMEAEYQSLRTGRFEKRRGQVAE